MMVATGRGNAITRADFIEHAFGDSQAPACINDPVFITIMIMIIEIRGAGIVRRIAVVLRMITVVQRENAAAANSMPAHAHKHSVI